MYAVIAAGGKQARVEVGSRLDVERVAAGAGDEVTFPAVLVVDGDDVQASPAELAKIAVTGKVVGESSGPKIVGFTYRPKARGRRRFGHRQHYTTVEITKIGAPASSRARAKRS